MGNIGVGKLVDAYGYTNAWYWVGGIGLVTIASVIVLNVKDKKSFPLLYQS